MSLIATPDRTEAGHDRDLERRVAELEALIEEARRRARRRRRLYAGAVLAALAAGVAASFDLGGSGQHALGVSVAQGSPGSSAAHAGGGVWAPSHGPDGGALSLAVDPTNGRILYAGGSGNVFKSTNGGTDWKDVTSEPWTRVWALAVDPTRPYVVYAGTDYGVAKTTDGGRHWTMMNRGLFVGQPHRRGEGVGSLVVDRRHPQTLIAARDGALFKSTNGGGFWRVIGPPRFRTMRCPGCAVLAYGYFAVVAIDPSNTRTMYGSWERGAHANLFKSTDGGDHWHGVALQSSFLAGAGDEWFGSLAFDSASQTLYATGTSVNGVYRSTDGGVTWSSAGLQSQPVWNLSLDAGTLYASTENGAFTSTDGGTTWAPVGSGANLPTGAVVRDPQDPDTRYGLGSNGVVKSVDAGSTWSASDNGMVSTSVSSIVLASGSSTRLYAGVGGQVFSSPDGAQTWHLLGGGVGTAAIGVLALDPRNRRVLYAGTESGGMFKSTDGGSSWQALATNFPATWVSALAIDPQQPQTIYVGACKVRGGCGGVGTFLKSVDGGVTWQQITAVPWAVQSLAIDPRAGRTVFAGTNRGGIFRSTDGGRTWRRLTTVHAVRAATSHLSLPGAVLAIAIAPSDSSIVYAVSRTGGVVKSVDGGNTWTVSSSGLSDLRMRTIAVDPRDPTVVYASTLSGVFRSTDGARSWHPFGAGLSPTGVSAFAVGPTGASVFAATQGDGVVKLRR